MNNNSTSTNSFGNFSSNSFGSFSSNLLGREPGALCGIQAAQNVLRNVTQSRLSSFHSAGTISGGGYPRPSIQSIMDGKVNSTNSSMKIVPVRDMSLREMMIVGGRISSTILRDVTNAITIVAYSAEDRALAKALGIVSTRNNYVRMSLDVAKMYKRGISTEKVATSVVAFFEKHSKTVDLGTRVIVLPDIIGAIDIPIEGERTLNLCFLAMSECIGGSELVTDMKISHEDGKGYVGITYGSDLSILGLSEINEEETISNDPYDVYRILGIEAARAVLHKELVDSCHLDRDCSLIADTMTRSGEVRSFTKNSSELTDKKSPMYGGVLAEMSFERPRETIVSSVDVVSKIHSPHADIMVGNLPRVGTGTVNLMRF